MTMYCSVMGAIKTMPISEFKATCLSVLERVRLTGEPLLVTRRGQPVAIISPPPAVVAPSWLGSCADDGSVFQDDLIAPAVAAEEWEAVQGAWEPR
jgi:prevent-host-death family protein